MHIINASEISRVQVKRPRGGLGIGSANEHIRKEIGTLAVGQGLIIMKDAWAGISKPSPSGFGRQLYKSGKIFNVCTLQDDSGWLVKRTA
jgi:hypothetical protein